MPISQPLPGTAVIRQTTVHRAVDTVRKAHILLSMERYLSADQDEPEAPLPLLGLCAGGGWRRPRADSVLLLTSLTPAPPHQPWSTPTAPAAVVFHEQTTPSGYPRDGTRRDGEGEGERKGAVGAGKGERER